ncbi:hypothetical protein AAFF_G00146520 [Aldrovandia affinis]|uniref:Fucolectin tachylectin-4 pentraxin-1 domain-containing protein n=1 Tax=Aldrovandia affinis TaxID=143900 RepID=A0AAD7VWE7_9TELE|nr:hypothetical protein AAFF_G00146520 [Aldrovandia affinis]
MNAIDGSHQTTYESRSCTHTELQIDPWWRVDLRHEFRVTSVTITNREDCCPERLDGAQIRIGNSMENNGNNNPVCAVVSTIPAGESATFSVMKWRAARQYHSARLLQVPDSV